MKNKIKYNYITKMKKRIGQNIIKQQERKTKKYYTIELNNKLKK